MQEGGKFVPLAFSLLVTLPHSFQHPLDFRVPILDSTENCSGNMKCGCQEFALLCEANESFVRAIVGRAASRFIYFKICTLPLLNGLRATHNQ